MTALRLSMDVKSGGWEVKKVETNEQDGVGGDEQP